MNKKKIIRFGMCVISAILLITVLYAVYQLSLRMLFELRGPYTGDTPVYWAVGRGITNGLVPYLDLFETKPPGIFLLSALSFWIFDSPLFTHIAQAFVIGFLPFITLLVALHFALEKKLKTFELILIGSISFLFGSIVAHYVGVRSGFVQVESFGAFFASAYLALIALNWKKYQVTFIIISGILLSAAIGFKEPFLLSAVSGLLVLIYPSSNRTKKILLSIAVAFIFGIAFLWVIGYLGPYWNIYLSDAFGRRVAMDSVLIRGIDRWQKPFDNLFKYSPYLYWSIALLFITYIYFQFKKSKNYFFGILNSCWIIPAVLLTSIAVGMGGQYFNHHFVFGVPLYLALFFVFLQCVTEYWKDTVIKLSVGLMTFIAVFGMWNLYLPDFNNRVARTDRRETIEIKKKAAVIDQLLDSCNLDRYLFIGRNGVQPYGFTKHSPLGPIFFSFGHWFERDNAEKIRGYFWDSLQEANVIVMKNENALGSYAAVVRGYTNEHFVNDPWDCARDISIDQMGGYRLYFRKES